MYEFISAFATQKFCNFAVFERKFLFESYIERAKHFTSYQVSQVL